MQNQQSDSTQQQQHQQQQQQQQHEAVASTTPAAAVAVGPGWTWPTNIESYSPLSKIGQGAFGIVYRSSCTLPQEIHPDMVDSTINTSSLQQQQQQKQEQQEGEVEGSSEGRVLHCAIKVLDLEHFDTNFSEIRSEVLTLRLSNHENVLQFFTCFVHDATHQLFLVTQLMNKGSSLRCVQEARRVGLVGKRHGLREEWITYILHETLLGLCYFHDHGQIHRDVKAGNILVDGMGNVRIADFGVSGWLISADHHHHHHSSPPSHQSSQPQTQNNGAAAAAASSGMSKTSRRDRRARTFVGTPCWMAPEVMEQVTGYDYHADLWSLGITALELAKGYAPYAKYPPMKVLLLTIQEPPPSLETYEDEDEAYADDEEDEEGQLYYERRAQQQQQLQQRPPPPQQQVFSRTFRDAVRQCLEKDPKKRPNCRQLLAHKQFSPYAQAAFREEMKAQMKRELCDCIDDVGVVVEEEEEERRNKSRPPGSTPIFTVLNTTANDRPKGTSWIFPDGSQVFLNSAASSKRGGAGAGGGKGGVGAGAGAGAGAGGVLGMSELGNDHDFFDEFEKATAGEHFQPGQQQQQQQELQQPPEEPQQQPATVVEAPSEKSEMDDFFDEFEKSTGGEHFRKL